MCVSEPLPRRREGEKERRKPEDEEKGGKRLKRTEKDDKGHQRQMNTLGLFPGRLPERIGGSARLLGLKGQQVVQSHGQEGAQLNPAPLVARVGMRAWPLACLWYPSSLRGTISGGTALLKQRRRKPTPVLALVWGLCSAFVHCQEPQTDLLTHTHSLH